MLIRYKLVHLIYVDRCVKWEGLDKGGGLEIVEVEPDLIGKLVGFKHGH